MTRLVVGRRAVQELLAARRADVSVIYTAHEESKPLREIIALARRAGVRYEACPTTALDGLAAEMPHQGVVAIAGEYPYTSVSAIVNGQRAPMLVALDQIQDPHNFGAIVRSAVALGAAGVLTLKDRACPVTAAVVRAAAGATERASIARVTNLARTLETLHGQGLQIVGLAAEGDVKLEELPVAPDGRVLVVGSEGKGLRRLVRKYCEHLARIELPGPIGSLNASVAAGIAIHASCRQRADSLAQADG